MAIKTRTSKRGLNPKARAIQKGYRSGLEEDVAKTLEVLAIPFKYEKLKIRYLIPASRHDYTPDFLLLGNGIIVETKGFFSPEDRAKHTLIKSQYPWLDIRFVFDNPNNKIGKGSKTTYAAWSEKNGFLYAKKEIPIEWTMEPSKDYLPKLLELIERGRKLDEYSIE